MITIYYWISLQHVDLLNVHLKFRFGSFGRISVLAVWLWAALAEGVLGSKFFNKPRPAVGQTLKK
jgi:hypothetical protein